MPWDIIIDESELKKIFDETDEKFLVPPAHLQDFEHNTANYDKTIDDSNVVEEMKKNAK